ncbi:MAG: radical SAM protein [Candidatus Melainabacteria bacterium]|nr:radical SAM protein [Candidatus Melainabacteria bacterium]
MKEKVLLLNPPGKESYIRDYYCNNISKSSYLHYPMDLLYLSGTLTENHFEVSVLDALIKKYSEEETLKRIFEINPDYLIALVGSISWHEDKKLLRRVKAQNLRTKIIGTGDVFLDNGTQFLKENNFFDGCILDFSDDSILHLIEKCKKNGSDPICGKAIRLKGEFSIPTPRHEYFPLKEYKYAFSRNYPTAHIMTDFGCAFNCSFCPIRNDNLGFKVRPVNDVIKELKYLKSLEIKELYFRDQTFGANKKRAIELCKKIVEEDLKFSWHCFSRVDVVNEELLDAMKQAGCHTIIFGIESVNEKTLQDVQKRIDIEKIKNTFNLCKRKKIRRAATFIIGLPDETEEDVMRTVQFAIDIDCTFASFNIAGIRPGTEWSHHSEKIHFLPQEELERIRNNAIKKFYLRPSYIINRISEITSLHDVNVLIEEGAGVLVNLFK